MRSTPRHGSAAYFILVPYLAVVVAVFLYFNMRFNVEWVALVLFGAAVLTGKARLFLLDWGVFFVVLLAWQVSSGLATTFGFSWHLTELIAADRLMFAGHVPAVWLQQRLYHPNHLEPWDVLAASMYMLHFLAPLVAGFLIWLANRDLFRKFAATFVLVALAGFATYIVYPAVPPWMAGNPLVQVGHQYATCYGAHAWLNSVEFACKHPHRYLPGVKNLFNVIMNGWYNPYNGRIFLPLVQIHYDQVAAMPSEHAAYPMLFYLFLRRQFGRVGHLALIYLALVLFSITYLGQHYVIDAFVGMAYAVVGYALIMHGLPRLLARLQAARRPAATLAFAGRPEIEESPS